MTPLVGNWRITANVHNIYWIVAVTAAHFDCCVVCFSLGRQRGHVFVTHVNLSAHDGEREREQESTSMQEREREKERERETQREKHKFMMSGL